MDGDRSLGSRIEVLRACGQRTVEAVAAGEPLDRALTALILDVEAYSDIKMFGSVLLLDGRRLVEGAAPSLPQDYRDAINGIEVGPAVGSCGTAAHYGESVFVDDIKHDPLWADFKDVALANGLRACWSTPIKDADGKVLGAFANYYAQPRHPRSVDYEAIEVIARYVAKAIAARGDAA